VSAFWAAVLITQLRIHRDSEHGHNTATPFQVCVLSVGETDDANEISNNGKPTTSEGLGGGTKDGFKIDPPRSTTNKRFGGDNPGYSKANPSGANTIAGTAGLPTPTTGGSSAFGLGSGAFASFGAAKGAKTAMQSEAANGEKEEKETLRQTETLPTRPAPEIQAGKATQAGTTTGQPTHPLKTTWVVWYRPPTSKYSDYEKSTIALASFSTVETFWTLYTHLKHPSALPVVSDYHIFRKGVRPVWEDEGNKRGGKWIVRLRKGIADRYWEDLLLGIVGDQFAEAGDEICGAVLSVRTGEDVLSVWTRIDGGRNVKIR